MQQNKNNMAKSSNNVNIQDTWAWRTDNAFYKRKTLKYGVVSFWLSLFKHVYTWLALYGMMFYIGDP